MQLALDQDRQRLKLLRHEYSRLARSLSECEAKLRSYDEELDICLAADKDDLARDLIRRKLAGERQVQALHNQSETVAAQTEVLERQIEEQDEQLTGMKQKLELLASSPEPSVSGSYCHGDAIRNEEVEIALLREKERRANA